MRRAICLFPMGLLLVGLAAVDAGQARKRRRPSQFKRVHIAGMKLLVAGKHEQAAAEFRKLLEATPNDGDAHYGLAAAQAQLGDFDGALASVRKAVAAGLAFGRFLAGPRTWFQPLLDHAGFQKLAEEQGVGLVHGPMLGCVTDSSAAFWVRTAREAGVQVIATHADKLARPLSSATVRTKKEHEFTAVAQVKGLEPNARYTYQVMVDGKGALGTPRPQFHTSPPRGQKARFQVGFGGGAGYVPPHERMWDTVLKHQPLAFLLLGDNVYIDTPTMPDIQRYCYYRRQSRPEYRRFCAATAIYAVWDDHDFGTNDCANGREIDKPAWKLPVWHVFRSNWNNPAYGGGSEKQPGCWFDFSIGDVDIFMTDGRYYRDHPKKVERPSMLGAVQKQWLLARLKASKATFKVLCSGTPWAYGAKPGSRDPWQGFKAERKEIFDFIEQHKIAGVILLSADRHRSDVWKLDRQVGYPLYEFESSRLTNQHRHGKMKDRQCLFSYNAKQSFGLLAFDTTKPDPEVTYRIFSIDDEQIHEVTLRKSQLTPR